MGQGIRIAAAVTAATACMSVRPVAAPEQFIPARQPEIVWVTTHEEEIIPVARPALQNAAIMGTWLGLGDSVAVPLRTARMVHARQTDRTRTALLVVGVGAAAGLIVWRAVAGNAGHGEVCYGWQYGTPACF